MKRENLAICKQHKIDCMMYSKDKNRCIALSETSFDKECPFYKKRKTKEKPKNTITIKPKEEIDGYIKNN